MPAVVFAGTGNLSLSTYCCGIAPNIFTNVEADPIRHGQVSDVF
jgi:hypothetical protein